MDGLDDLLSELKAQGRNLNQLTTLANMGRLSVLRGDELVSEYTRLCDTLGALVQEALCWQRSPRSKTKNRRSA